jgi:hypothetical protein
MEVLLRGAGERALRCVRWLGSFGAWPTTREFPERWWDCG